MFGLLKKRDRQYNTDDVAATSEFKVKNPARKCPFMYPLVHKDQNELPSHIFYDCMRQACQIWDGQNCSLHFDMNIKDRLKKLLDKLT